MPVWPFSASKASEDAELLLSHVARAGRNPALFGEGRAPDTLDGRFELVALHAALVLLRLREEPDAQPLAQAFVDALFRHLDHGLRESGVGDLAVPKRMHRLAGAFYGRVEAYRAGLGAEEANGMRAALERNVAGISAPFATRLADHVRTLAAAQAARPWPGLLKHDGWIVFAG